MIYVSLQGGLGNQLFQYATAFCLAKKHNTHVMLNDSLLKRVNIEITSRDYELSNFNITGKLMTKSDHKLFTRSRKKISRFIPGINFITSWREHSEYSFDKAFNTLPDQVYLEGYWQSFHYFESVRAALIEELTPKARMTATESLFFNKVSKSNSVAIHIRRGDYVTSATTSKYHGVCNPNYYYKSIEKINSMLVNPEFFIFTDDPEWVLKSFNNKLPYTLVYNEKEPLKAYQDLHLMSACKHQIIANSSFSWWAAWLNSNSTKVVIHPKNWLLHRHVDLADLIPKSWLMGQED